MEVEVAQALGPAWTDRLVQDSLSASCLKTVGQSQSPHLFRGPAEGCTGPTHHLKKAQVVTKGGHHADEGDEEHDDAKEDEDNGRGQKGAFEGFVFLPLDLCIDPHGQDQGSNQLQQESRE